MRAVSDDIDAAMLYENDWKPFEDPTGLKINAVVVFINPDWNG